MDFRQRLEQNRLTPVDSIDTAAQDEPITCPYFATDNSSRLNCIDLRLPQGVRKAFPYAFITEINFDVDAGIEILSQGKKINIIGRNLTKLFDHLIAYRVRYIQANIGSDLDEDGLVVKGILVTEQE